MPNAEALLEWKMSWLAVGAAEDLIVNGEVRIWCRVNDDLGAKLWLQQCNSIVMYDELSIVLH